MRKLIPAIFAVFLVLAVSGCLGQGSGVPAPWRLAINDQTHECGSFWPGDELIYYDLPAGWLAYGGFDISEIGEIETPLGNCNATIFSTQGPETCCEQLGLTLVTGNVGVRTSLKPMP